MNTKNPKIIGLLTAWGAEDWIEPAIKQSLEYCDEVMVCIAAHTEALKKFEDKSHEIASSFEGISMITFEKTSTHSRSKAAILNQMLEDSKLFKPGNWIWILDVDEFYPKSGYEEIESVIGSKDYDHIRVEERFFLINMHHFLQGWHGRLFRIKPLNMLPWCRFKPTQRWSGKFTKIYTLPRENGMFHYSLLTNPHMRKVQWENEYPNSKQTNKTRWLDEIYRHYDLDNEDYWIKRNLELTGVKSPWFGRGFQPDENGRLFKYDGKHPKFIEETNLPKISDFRKKYGFE